MSDAPERWIIGLEYDKRLFLRLGGALRDLGFIIDESWWGVAGSQEVSHWELRSPHGAVIVEAETFCGLSVEGPQDLVRRIRLRFETVTGEDA